MIYVHDNPVISPCWKKNKTKTMYILIVKSDRNLMSTVKKTNPMKFLSSSDIWELATWLSLSECQKDLKMEK